MRLFYVYMLASLSRRLYVGVTNDLVRRVWQHKHGDSEFTRRYRIHRLVYYETVENPYSAIAREKELKDWRRAKKIALIERSNPEWRDLAIRWFE